MNREADPDPRSATYILVHLNEFEIEESLVHSPTDWDWWPSYEAFCKTAATLVETVSSRCASRLLIVDETTASDAANGDEEVWGLGGGRGIKGWEVVVLEPRDVSKIAARLTPGERVIVAGYARRDCVARVAAACERRGCKVVLHDIAVLPLTGAAMQNLALFVDRSTGAKPGSSWASRRSEIDF